VRRIASWRAASARRICSSRSRARFSSSADAAASVAQNGIVSLDSMPAATRIAA